MRSSRPWARSSSESDDEAGRAVGRKCHRRGCRRHRKRRHPWRESRAAPGHISAALFQRASLGRGARRRAANRGAREPTKNRARIGDITDRDSGIVENLDELMADCLRRVWPGRMRQLTLAWPLPGSALLAWPASAGSDAGGAQGGVVERDGWRDGRQRLGREEF